MKIYVDLLGIPGAEKIEHNGIKGIFIPEVPNYREQQAKGNNPARATIAINLWPTKNKAQRYDFSGQMQIYPEHAEAYLSNPRAVNRTRFVAFGYKWSKSDTEKPTLSSPSDFERILDND